MLIFCSPAPHHPLQAEQAAKFSFELELLLQKLPEIVRKTLEDTVRANEGGAGDAADSIVSMDNLAEIYIQSGRRPEAIFAGLPLQHSIDTHSLRAVHAHVRKCVARRRKGLQALTFTLLRVLISQTPVAGSIGAISPQVPRMCKWPTRQPSPNNDSCFSLSFVSLSLSVSFFSLSLSLPRSLPLCVAVCVCARCMQRRRHRHVQRHLRGRRCHLQNAPQGHSRNASSPVDHSPSCQHLFHHKSAAGD